MNDRDDLDNLDLDTETGELTQRAPARDLSEIDDAEIGDLAIGDMPELPPLGELPSDSDVVNNHDDGEADLAPTAGKINWGEPFWLTIYQTLTRTFTDFYQGEFAEQEARAFASDKATRSGQPVAVLGPQVDVYAVPREIRAEPMRLAFKEGGDA